MSTKQLLIIGMVVITSGLWASTSQASSITTFTGQDDGAPTTGPFTLSTAAQSGFETAASAFGTLNTIDFESLALGYYSPIAAGAGVAITLSGSDFGPGFSGISNSTLGNLYGFNTTPSGSQWLGFAEGSATFTFATPTNSFGMFMTGLQQVFSGTNGLTITFNDGTPETLTPPINVNGGAEYFGFTDTSSFTSVTITDLTNDAWGIDDVTFNTANTATPEPATLLLFGTGLAALATRLRKKLS